MTAIDTEAREQRSEAYGETAVDSVSAGECDGSCFFADCGGKVICVTCGHAAPVLASAPER